MSYQDKKVFKNVEVEISAIPLVINTPESKLIHQQFEKREETQWEDPVASLQSKEQSVILHPFNSSAFEKKEIDDLEQKKSQLISEIEDLKAQKQQILQDTEEEKQNILNQAKVETENQINKQQMTIEEMKIAFEEEKQEALKIQKQNHKTTEKFAHQKGYEEGLTQGKIEGLEKGTEETQRVIKTLHQMVSEMFNERKRILNEAEGEIVELVLLIANKVVKSITTNYKRVVYDNVIEALKKLQVYSGVAIRVHPDDLYTLTKYKQQILDTIQELEGLKIVEDPSIDVGGCIVSSEFGSVDARIASQLNEIEEQIRRINPIKEI